MSATDQSSENAATSAAILDSMQWQMSLGVVTYGVRFGVRANYPEIAAGLEDCLPPGSICEAFSETDTERTYSIVLNQGERQPGRRYSLFRDRTLHAHCSTAEGALRFFESEAQLFVAEMAPDRVFVHAGVVGCDGRAILLPGRSFTGKSTLVAELVRAGADYYSDEYAVLDSVGDVHPYPRPLSVRPRSGGPTAMKHSAESLGGQTGTQPLPVGLVVVTEFHRNGEWIPKRLSPGAGALALLANTVSARRNPEVVMATLRKVVANAPIVATERGEVAEVVKSILNMPEELTLDSDHRKV